MQRAATVLAKLRSPGLSMEDLACAAWKKAVGSRLASRTRAARLVRSTLVIQVEDAVWQQQLFALTPHLLINLGRILGPEAVTQLVFEVGLPRIAPGSAQTLSGAESADEADGIQDAVMRRVYRESRQNSRRRAAGTGS
jgi:hypothetical protein